MNRAILQVVIQGRVQGVGYRAWVEYQARAAHLDTQGVAHPPLVGASVGASVGSSAEPEAERFGAVA